MQIDPHADRSMLTALRAAPRGAGNRPGERTGGRRPWLQLLSGVLGLAGPAAELLRHSERPWASATFSGTRHVIALQFAGDEGIASAEAFMEALPDHEFALSRHVVIEAAIRSVEQEMMPQARLTLEAEFLLLEDA